MTKQVKKPLNALQAQKDLEANGIDIGIGAAGSYEASFSAMYGLNNKPEPKYPNVQDNKGRVGIGTSITL